MADLNLQAGEVEEEHLRTIRQGLHWAYLAGVLAIGGVLMLLLIAWLDAAG